MLRVKIAIGKPRLSILAGRGELLFESIPRSGSLLVKPSGPGTMWANDRLCLSEKKFSLSTNTLVSFVLLKSFHQE